MEKFESMRDGFSKGLIDVSKQNSKIVALDSDLASATKFSEFASLFPDRFFQIGIAEQNMASIAAGLASIGLLPFIGTFACFASCRITDQVRTSIAQPCLPVNIIAPYSGLRTGQTGKTHQAVEDISVYRGMPNMTIISPADSIETQMVIKALPNYGKPTYIRLTRDPEPIIFDDNHLFTIGKAYLLRTGKDVTFISTGSLTSTVISASRKLQNEGVEATILHVPTIKPLDVKSVIDSAKMSNLVITVEEHNIYGGLGGAVTEVLSEFYPVPVFRFGIQDTFGESGHNDPLMEKYGLTENHLLKATMDWIKKWNLRKSIP